MYIILDLQRNTAWRYILISSIALLLLPGYFFLTLTDPLARANFSDVCGFIYNCLAAGACCWATYQTRQQEPRLFRAWFVLTLAVFTVLIAVSYWFFLEIILQQKAAPTTGAGFILGSNFLIWLGIYLIPTVQANKAQLARRVIDSVTVLLGGALLLWWLWIDPLLQQSTTTFTTLLVAVSYPVSDFILIGALVSLLFHQHLFQPRWSLFLIGLTIIFMLTGDLWYAQQTITNRYQSGQLGDYLWLIAWVFAGTGAALQATARKGETPAKPPLTPRRRLYSIRVVLPPIMLLLTYSVMIVVHKHEDSITHLLMAGGVALMFILVSLRQLLTVVENFNLAHALRVELAERQRTQLAIQHSNERLEERVAARTQELAVANEQLRQNEQQLRFDAFHDKLTELPNRAFFVNQLEQTLQVAYRDPMYKFAVLFLDFDGFKVVNDSLGHWLGDEFLIALARRLEVWAPPGTLIARLGGDEFVLLLANLLDQEEPLHVAEHLQRELRQPFEVCGYRLFTSASIGVVLNDAAHRTPGDLLRDADIAMYRAKENGKARCVVFDTTMRSRAMMRLGLETDLRNALLRQELHLVYQPIWNLRQQCLMGFEALARWRHAKHGLIPPSEFIPVAEETGLIIPLGEWVLETACRQLKDWHQQWPQSPLLTISVNISAHQLYQTDLAALVERILNKVDLPAAYLKLEITESAYMKDIEAAITAFGELRTLGVQLQLDDFGTGYSSFSYLHRLPLNTLKIDQTFIKEIATEDKHIEIVRTITTLAHHLQMSVIAEGVETHEQLANIAQVGCEQVQGYLIAKPLDCADAERFIRASLGITGAASQWLMAECGTCHQPHPPL